MADFLSGSKRNSIHISYKSSFFKINKGFQIMNHLFDTFKSWGKKSRKKILQNVLYDKGAD